MVEGREGEGGGEEVGEHGASLEETSASVFVEECLWEKVLLLLRWGTQRCEGR